MLGKRDLNVLREAAHPGDGMYPGVKRKHVARKRCERLLRLGLIQEYWPHNAIHDDRLVATEAGRAALEVGE